jgi:uncharacterized protein GlcG (DUF336 family)
MIDLVRGSVAVVLTMLTTMVPAQAEPVVMATKRLALETATAIAQATLDECRERGVQIAVTVVDRGGHAQVVLRDVYAPDLTLGISRDKAYTALAFGVPTSDLADRADSPLGRRDGLVMVPGGLPIRAGGELVGAVGVSGAPDGDVDQACAQSGVDAVQADLDMAGM